MFSITGEHDHTPFGDQGVQLVWGQRPNRSLAHISEVDRGGNCDCVCPACELALIAKKGPRIAAHFAHRGGTACAGVRETNAHAWAKKVLEARKEIYLPPVIGSAAGKRLQTYPGQLYQFVSARLEKREGSIIPDVVLIDAEERELIVEILVTHACDDVKIAKITEQGTPAIEVDLSGLRRAASEEIVAESLIGAVEITRAPRHWIHNAKIERAAELLQAELARQAAAREAAREREAHSIIRAAAAIRIVSTDATLGDLSTVNDYDRANLIRVEIRGSRGFCVPLRLWQAAVLARVVFPASEEWGTVFDAQSAREAILDCIAPAFRVEPAADLQGRIARTEPGFILPSVAVTRYLFALADRRILERENYDSFRLDDDEGSYLRHRAVELAAQRDRNESAQLRLRAILDRIPEADRESFSLDAWRARPIEGLGARLADLIEKGDRRWEEFDAGLRSIERMFRDGSPASATLGLPIGPEIAQASERARVAREEAEKARRAAEARAARQRVEWLTERATRALGPEFGEEWLATVPPSGIVSFGVLARGSSEGLEHAQAALAVTERELIERRTREREAERCRAELRKKAIDAFGLERAEIFLLSTHPRIGVKPWDHCTDSAGLRDCLTLLPKKAAGGFARSRLH
jgi:hypothetical protein